MSASSPSSPPTIGLFVVGYPYFRYTQYSELSDDSKDAATVLGYNNNANNDWDLPNTNPIEKSAFFSLTDDQKEAAKTLGFPIEPYVGIDLNNYEDSDTWDCYVNHYGGYGWDELVEYDLAQYWEALGYNSKHWEENSTEEIPPAAGEFWDGLTEDEQAAAASLCYFEQTWNEDPTIDLWPDDLQGPAPPTAPPSKSPTVSPTTAAPTPLPTMTPTNVDGSTNPPKPTPSPTMAPTTPPTAKPTTATPSEAADVTTSSPTETTSGAFARASSTNLRVSSVFAVVVLRMLLA